MAKAKPKFDLSFNFGANIKGEKKPKALKGKKGGRKPTGGGS